MSLPSVYYNDDPRSFAHPTCHKRWPIILTDGLEAVRADIAAGSGTDAAGDALVAKLELLSQALAQDARVEAFSSAAVERNSDLARYNDSLARFHQCKPVTWLTGPWLFLECYLYQLINLYVLETESERWLLFDIFEQLKTSTFRQLELGVLELCKQYESLEPKLAAAAQDLDALEVLFAEFCDILLWGNATDLSLLAGNVTLEDIKSVQGAEVRKRNEEKILVNDLNRAWLKLAAAPRGAARVDVVLDNSGFELFTDLVLGLFLLDSGLARHFHIHVKSIPWFVSDTMSKDVDVLLHQLVDERFFTQIHANADDAHAIRQLQQKLVAYRAAGRIVVEEDAFWTLDCNYWRLADSSVAASLQQSQLIIFKGDLNYRKLTGDLMWPKTTPFAVAIQDLAHSGLPVLSLRTCKADVVVGLPPGLNEQLIAQYQSMGNDVGEFWSSSGKWAVISYNQ